MEEKEWKLPEGSLRYGLFMRGGQRKAVITGLSGPVSCLEIPEELEGCPVAVIGRKAFLSCKSLRRVWLPASLEELEDWAFAYCGELEEVELPAGPLRTGRSVFLDCGKLERLGVRGASPEVPELLAAALRYLDAYYLLDPPHAGNGEWLEKWDARLLSFLHEGDQEGFSRQVLCGEEDYGSTDLEGYLSRRRRDKVRLCFLRLLNPSGLSPALKEELEEYLRAHTKGCPGEETWEVVWKERGEERRYFELFAGLGCLTEENFDGVLRDMGDGHPEMKAYFLKIRGERMGSRNFFEGLSLD